MTLQTLTELTVNCPVMRQAMALLASRRRGVEPLVTVDTIDATMVGFGCGQIGGSLLVTNSALRVRHITDRNNHQRLVGGVTTPAIRLGLGRLVRLVTLQAARDFPVPGMTAVAEQFCMPTRRQRHQLADFVMT